MSFQFAYFTASKGACEIFYTNSTRNLFLIETVVEIVTVPSEIW